MTLPTDSGASTLLTERLLEESSDGIFIFDRDERIMVWNPVMERLFGLRAERVLGRQTNEVFPFLTKAGVDRHHAAALAGELVTLHDQLFHMPETLRTLYVDLRYVPLANRYGYVTAVLGMAREAACRAAPRGAAIVAGVESGAPLIAADTLEWGGLRTTDAQASGGRSLDRGRTDSTLATAAHELRTPISAILGYVELLSGELSEPATPTQQQYLGHIARSAQHLLSIANRILGTAKREAQSEEHTRARDVTHVDLRDLRSQAPSRMQTQTALSRIPLAWGDDGGSTEHATPQRQRCRALDAIATALVLVQPQAAARGVTLSNGVEEQHDFRYYGDPEWVTRILVNLLSNAVKFTPPGGRVIVFAGEAARPDCVPGAAVAAACPAAACPGVSGDGTVQSWTYLRVDDTGVGIAPEQLDAIFRPFVQGATAALSANGTAPNGAGLGLTISRQLAREMGGEITVASRVNAGSRFTLWLPADEPARREVLRAEAAGIR